MPPWTLFLFYWKWLSLLPVYPVYKVTSWWRCLSVSWSVIWYSSQQSELLYVSCVHVCDLINLRPINQSTLVITLCDTFSFILWFRNPISNESTFLTSVVYCVEVTHVHILAQRTWHCCSWLSQKTDLKWLIQPSLRGPYRTWHAIIFL